MPKMDVVQLTTELVSYPSVSLTSNLDVTRHAAQLLMHQGFQIEELSYTDVNGVDKLSIVAKLGSGRGGLALMSHDDVVPADAPGWTSNPFQTRRADGRLYGRGTCDMKGPLAASICAASHFKSGDLHHPLYIVITADEEITAVGARDVTRRSRLFSEASTGYGIICEPTRLNVVHAHKGSLAMVITSKGRAGHTSTLKGVNANIRMIPFLAEMKKIYHQVLTASRYRNEEFRPPHSEWSIGINDNNAATNVFPAESVCTIGYRPMPGIDVDSLIKRTRQIAQKHKLEFRLKHRADPLYTAPDAPLVKTALTLAGKRKPTTVAYGTDGTAYAARMKQMVVLGPGDIAQAHTVDEWIDVDQLRRSVDLYANFIEHVCVRGDA